MFCLTIQSLDVLGVNKAIPFFNHYELATKRRWKSKRVLSFNLGNFATKRETVAVMMSTKGNEVASTVMLTSGASGRINALFSLRAWRSLLMIVEAFLLLFILPFRRRKAVVVMATGGGAQGGGGGPSMCNGKEEKHTEKKSTAGAMVRVPSAMVPWKTSSSAAVDQEVSARRSLAIKRVMQDDGSKESVRQFSLFPTSRGDILFTQSWTPISIKVRGLVVLLHGLNEHSGRYSDFAKQLNKNGYKVYGMDWIGHGGSDGLHAYVHSLDDAVSDTQSFIRKVAAENPGLPCFCFGHSTGAAIILKAVLDPDVKACVAGVIMTSPAVGVQPSHPIFAVLAPVFSWLLPRYQFSAANKRGSAVSRDPEALLAKYSDPLVFTGSIRIRTGYEILRICTQLQQNLPRMTVPFFVLHGSDDLVTDPEASEKLYKMAASTDKKIRLLDGLLHDLLFEPEKEEIMQDIIQWLNERS